MKKKQEIDPKLIGFTSTSGKKSYIAPKKTQTVNPQPRKKLTKLEELANGGGKESLKPYKKKIVRTNFIKGLTQLIKNIDIDDEQNITNNRCTEKVPKVIYENLDNLDLKDESNYLNSNLSSLLVKNKLVDINIDWISEYIIMLSNCDEEEQFEILKLIGTFCKEKEFPVIDNIPLIVTIMDKIIDCIIDRDIFSSWFQDSERKIIFQLSNWYAGLEDIEEDEEDDFSDLSNL